MKSKIMLLVATVLLTLACAAPLATAANIPPTATQKPQEQKNTPQPTATAFSATEPLIVFGCWNIREGASLEFPILSVQCGGELLPLEWAANGWVRVAGGYVCNRAFGFNEECR